MAAAQAARRRPLPELPEVEQQWQDAPQRLQHAPQHPQHRQPVCGCCAARSQASPRDQRPATRNHVELNGSPEKNREKDQRSPRSESPADSPPDSPRRALPPTPAVAMPLQLGAEAIGSEVPSGAVVPDAVHYIGSPTPPPPVQPRPKWEAHVAPLPFRPTRPRRRAAEPPVVESTSWSPLPYQIKPRPGESRNEAIARTVDQYVPAPTTPTPGTDGEWDGPLHFGKLTTVVDRYVYNQPWDRLVTAYYWRNHEGLDGDLHTSLLPFEPAETPGKYVIEYDCSIDMPKVVKVVARCDAYRWLDRQNIDVLGRSFRSYSSTEMWRDKFHTVEFIELFAVSDTETYVRKGLIADTSGGYPPRWVCEWIKKIYSQRSHAACLQIDKLAATIDDRQPGGLPAKSEHQDVQRIRSHLQMPQLSKPVANARPMWVAPDGFSA